MKRLFIFKTLDSFFRLFLIFLIVFVWIRYFINSFWLSFLLSIAITFTLDILYLLIKNKKQNKLNIKNEEQDKIECYINTFIYSAKKYNVDFFYKLCKTKYTVIKKTNYVVISHPQTNIILYPLFLYRELNVDDVINCYNLAKHEKPKRIVICTNKVSHDLQKLVSKLNIEVVILDKQQTYFSLLKKFNFYPKITKIENSQKITFHQFLISALDKKRAKTYFISALFLLFSSFFVAYKIYYLIFSTILLILCFLCLLSHKFNKPIDKKILDI